MAREHGMYYTETFSGIIHDKDLLNKRGNYVINYHLTLLDAELRDNKLIINKAELGLGTIMDKTDDLTDIQKEIKDMKKECSRYEKLAKASPDFKESDGLSYREVYETYKGLLNELILASKNIFTEIKEQIKDRINIDERVYYEDIRIENVVNIPFNRLKMSTKSVLI